MRRAAVMTVCLLWWAAPAPAAPLDLDHLDEPSRRQVQAIIKVLDPLITRRRAGGTLPLLTFGELYAPLTPDQQAVLDAIRAVDPQALAGSSRRLPPPAPEARFHRLASQRVRRGESWVALDDQYLPEAVYRAYRRMMKAMRRDLGRRLLVESGYRSPAHQLYLFLFYLPKHGYSIRETNRFVALPGCSEHGCPTRQAIDFINQRGINGEDHPEAFEALPEYAWLQRHAREYGFYLSYPRDHAANTSFEPWHWHYEKPVKREA